MEKRRILSLVKGDDGILAHPERGTERKREQGLLQKKGE